MTRVWGWNPQYKIEIGSSTFTNDFGITIQNVRPENNISSLVLTIDDYKSKNFIDVFDTLDTIDLSLRYGSDSWTKVFSGQINASRPTLDVKGERLEISAWGLENCIAQTYCNTSYGLESANPLLFTPDGICTDIIDNYVNKSFGGAATGHNIDSSKIESVHSDLNIANLTNPYLSNFTVINRICDLITAHVGAGAASGHWFVDPTGDCFLNTIGNHEDNASGWPTYWGGSQSASTIVVKEDMILYDFKKNVDEYANSVLLCGTLRKPAYDYWTESGSSLWGGSDSTRSNDATFKVVGANSLKVVGSGGGTPNVPQAWYPSAGGGGWDFTKIESPNTPPSLNFYFARGNTAYNAYGVCLDTSGPGNGYFTYLHQDVSGRSTLPTANEWVHFSIPFGNYYSRAEQLNFKWGVRGAGYNWNNINYILFYGAANVGTTPEFWVDDLHISGKIIRKAYNSTAITNNKEWQKIVKNDTALDDSMIAGTDSGTMAMLTKAELFRRQTTPIVGAIQIPLAVDMLPGQLVHIHACQKTDGTFRIDKDMRVKDLTHSFVLPYPLTRLNLTDDLYNAHANGVPNLADLIYQYAGALGHAEARDLKATGIDILTPILSNNYPS